MKSSAYVASLSVKAWKSFSDKFVSLICNVIRKEGGRMYFSQSSPVFRLRLVEASRESSATKVPKLPGKRNFAKVPFHFSTFPPFHLQKASFSLFLFFYVAKWKQQSGSSIIVWFWIKNVLKTSSGAMGGEAWRQSTPVEKFMLSHRNLWQQQSEPTREIREWDLQTKT